MTERKPLSISWSALRAHYECKQKAALLRAGKKSPSSNIRHFFHGTVADRVMRDWLNSDNPEPGQMVAMVDEYTNRLEIEARESGDGVVRWRGPSDKLEMMSSVRELVSRLEPLLQEIAIPHWYQPARRFRVPVEIPYLTGEPTCINLIGEIDLFIRTIPDGSYEIWDLKATTDEYYYKKTYGQLVFYAISTFIELGEVVTKVGLIQPLCNRRTMAFEVNEQQRKELWSQILRMCSDIWQKDRSPVADLSFCYRCPVKHACSRYSPKEGLATRRLSLGSLRSSSEGSDG